jgi:hypothetical protein
LLEALVLKKPGIYDRMIADNVVPRRVLSQVEGLTDALADRQDIIIKFQELRIKRQAEAEWRKLEAAAYGDN